MFLNKWKIMLNFYCTSYSYRKKVPANFLLMQVNRYKQMLIRILYLNLPKSTYHCILCLVMVEYKFLLQFFLLFLVSLINTFLKVKNKNLHSPSESATFNHYLHWNCAQNFASFLGCLSNALYQMEEFRRRKLGEKREKNIVSLKTLLKIVFLVKLFWSQFCFVRSYNFFMRTQFLK